MFSMASFNPFDQPRIAAISVLLLALLSSANCLDIYYEWNVTAEITAVYPITTNQTVSKHISFSSLTHHSSDQDTFAGDQDQWNVPRPTHKRDH